jgi:hypothetical protein
VDDRGDLELSVVWKDENGTEIPLPFASFPSGNYQAEIRVTAKDGYGFYPTVPFAYPEGKIQAQNDDLGSPARIIRVTYNHSDDADKIFVTNYNLQSYVPIPLAGEEPVRSVTRDDMTLTVDWNPSPAGNFELAAVYTADIRLSAADPYRFFAAKYFEYPAGTVTAPPDDDGGPAERNLTVTYKAAGTPMVVNDLNLTSYVPKPANGVMGVTSFTGPQYTGIVSWEPTAGPFQAGMSYTAVVSLTPAAGYSFTGVGSLVHTGAATLTTTATEVRINFSATASTGGAAVIDDVDLAGRIPRPRSGESPVTGITGPQYTGVVSWTPAPPGTFQYGTVYTAVLTLQAAPGYTFAGIGQNAFIHGAAPGAVTNPAGSGTVTITFPPTVSATYQTITSFGPAGDQGSALKLMKEKKDDNSLTIDLPEDRGIIEVVDPDPVTLTLEAGVTSPARVIINGHGRKLTIGGPGSLLTVGGGVTLTLRNITMSGLLGMPTNDAPLITVLHGGKLILGDGVTLTGNKNTGTGAGGVWVNGGELVLNPGSEISGMTAEQGGGVLVETFGTLFMNGGIIANNRASAADGGGGVLLSDGGTFTMADGTIQENTAAGNNSGGGVLVRASEKPGSGMFPSSLDVSFTMYGGAIQSNRAEGDNSGGGVLAHAAERPGGGMIVGTLKVSFTMFGGTIQSNRVEGDDSGGGVLITADDNEADAFFNMYGGTIGGGNGKANTAAASGANGLYALGGSVTMSGGTITGNGNGISSYGVLVYSDWNSAFTIKGAAKIEEDVSFGSSDPQAVIIIGGDLSNSPAANIIVADPIPSGTYLMRASSQELIEGNLDKLRFNGDTLTLSDIEIKYENFQYDGDYYFGLRAPPP